jgi:hypothetical protein
MKGNEMVGHVASTEKIEEFWCGDVEEIHVTQDGCL